jgi:hypothetical protein
MATVFLLAPQDNANDVHLDVSFDLKLLVALAISTFIDVRVQHLPEDHLKQATCSPADEVLTRQYLCLRAFD